MAAAPLSILERGPGPVRGNREPRPRSPAGTADPGRPRWARVGKPERRTVAFVPDHKAKCPLLDRMANASAWPFGNSTESRVTEPCGFSGRLQRPLQPAPRLSCHIGRSSWCDSTRQATAVYVTAASSEDRRVPGCPGAPGLCWGHHFFTRSRHLSQSCVTASSPKHSHWKGKCC